MTATLSLVASWSPIDGTYTAPFPINDDVVEVSGTTRTSFQKAVILAASQGAPGLTHVSIQYPSGTFRNLPVSDPCALKAA